MKHSRKTIAKLSAMRTGYRNPFYGRHHSDEFKAAQSARTRAYNATRQYEPSPQSIVAPSGPVAAYLAGMIDADGSVRFKRGRPFVSVYNTNVPLIDWLSKTLGGGTVSKGNMGRKQVFAWTITAARDVFALLCAVRPLMIVKASDADAALKFFQGKYEWAKTPE